tara:strand:- start:926 stop:1540 length:615 start_codon:yes stop_codon:yes gene_type:complete
MSLKNTLLETLTIILLLVSLPSIAQTVANITVLEGEAKLLAAISQQTTSLKVGDKIQINDVVSTGKSTKLKVVLLDKTVLDLGENSVLVVDQFVLGDSTSKGSVGASFKKGLFRYISGKTAKNKGMVKIKVPDAVITVRGTKFEALINDVNIPGQLPKTSILLETGAISIKSGDIIQELNQAGFVVDINGLGKVSKPAENRRCL